MVFFFRSWLLITWYGLRLKWWYHPSLLRYGNYNKGFSSGASAPVPQSVLRWIYIFRTAERNHLFSSNCLRSSLALRSCLEAVHIHTALCLGVLPKSSQDPLEAHAWLVYEGRPVFGLLPELEDYNLFTSGET